MQKILVFGPHPDDAEYYAGGLLANFIRAGAQVHLVIATNGNKGSFSYNAEELARIRRSEAIEAAGSLGLGEPIFMDYPDMELDRLPPGELRQKCLHLIRQYRPNILVAQDVFTSYDSHPDHLTLARAVQEASNSSSLPLAYPEPDLQSHFIVEKYFYTDNPARANRIVDITETFDAKMAALAKHASQVDFLVEDIERQFAAVGMNPGEIMSSFGGSRLAALTFALQTEAEMAGQQIGVKYAEVFHYERFHPMVEQALAQQNS